jgi:hypothetical protein
MRPPCSYHRAGRRSSGRSRQFANDFIRDLRLISAFLPVGVHQMLVRVAGRHGFALRCAENWTSTGLEPQCAPAGLPR